jgi:cephalosporin hydroxylase
MKNKIKEFDLKVQKNLNKMSRDKKLFKKSLNWMIHADKYKYTYNFQWAGIPVIKFPNDLVVLQEIISKVKPDVIIETGVAHGGSVVFSASMLQLYSSKSSFVIGIDIDIRKHNLIRLKKNKFYKKLRLIEGSSTCPGVIKKIKRYIKGKKKIMVFLDSNHSYEHVKNEIEIYKNLVSKNSYLVVGDTFSEYFPKGYYSNRPWDVGNNPMIALKEFLKKDKNFEIDKKICSKLQITETFDGYLKRIK